MLDINYLKEAIEYNPDTGVFVWKKRPRSHFANDRGYKCSNGKCAGKVAGTVSTKGYIMIALDGEYYCAGRLAWFYIHNEWPPEQIDHINRIRDDNRISNLRCVTNDENQKNKGMQKNNTSGHKGITWSKEKKKWVARANLNGKRLYLGAFDNKADAVKIRKEFEWSHG